MTKNIAFYISNHGYGHAARNIPIIATLLKLEEDMTIHVKTGKGQLEFMRSHLKMDDRLFLYEEPTDVGLVLKEGTMLIDEERLQEQIEDFVDSWDEKVENEKEFLLDKQIGLVISDICPWVLLAADELRIKSLLITNFTWIEIYKEYFSEELWDAYLECYEAASKVFIYDVHHPDVKTYNNDFEMISLVCRSYDVEMIEKIQSEHERPIVLISVGMSVNLSEEMDVSHLPYDFIVTPGLKVKGDNVTYLPVDTKNTQNYVAASKYVISKAGWSTISEILLSNTKSALLARPTVAEDRNAVAILKERNQCIDIQEEDLLDIGGIIEKLEEFSYSYDHEYHNDDYEIAKKILYAYPKRMRRRK